MEKFTKEYAKFTALAQNSLSSAKEFFQEELIGGELFKEGGGAIFLTSNTAKYILEKVAYQEKYILYKVVQADKIHIIKISLDGLNICYKKQLRWTKYTL